MTQYEVVGIGNAVVDVISHADDAFLQDNGIEKGIMQLIERDRAENLYATMQDRLQTPGGSVANTIAGIGALGLPTAFIGRVNDDDLGQFYAKAMTDIALHDLCDPGRGTLFEHLSWDLHGAYLGRRSAGGGLQRQADVPRRLPF